jgi:hypothetical protein
MLHKTSMEFGVSNSALRCCGAWFKMTRRCRTGHEDVATVWGLSSWPSCHADMMMIWLIDWTSSYHHVIIMSYSMSYVIYLGQM